MEKHGAFGLMIASIVGVTCFPASASAHTSFTMDSCMRKLTVQVDAPYRLSRPAANARCQQIERKIYALEALVLGDWERVDGGHAERLHFAGNGRLTSWRYDPRQGRVVEQTTVWAIENPYGTVGQESLTGYYAGAMSQVRGSGNQLTISTTPSRYEILDRWVRPTSIRMTTDQFTPQTERVRAEVTRFIADTFRVMMSDHPQAAYSQGLTPQLYRLYMPALHSGKIDWNIICNCNDPVAPTDLVVSEIKQDGAVANFTVNGKRTILTLVRLNGRWKIADAFENGTSILRSLGGR